MIKRESLKLLNRTSELTRLLEKSSNLKLFLTDLAKLIAAHMEVDACSFFIYDEDQNDLILQGTEGLEPSFVGNLRFKSGEGITGTVMKTLRPIKADYASRHPKFKPIPGIGEEQYESLLAVPIRRGRIRIGVITLHKRESSYFSLKDVTILMAIASQIASSVLSAGFLLSLKHHSTAPVEIESPIHGIGASPGIVMGKSLLYNRQQFALAGNRLEEDRYQQRQYTIEDFDRAIDQTKLQLKQIEEQLGENLSDIAGLIFTAHYLMLKDPNFTGIMRVEIEQGMSADQAVRKISNEYARLMAAIDNPRIQEKEQDVRDLEHRLLANLYDTTPEQRDYSDNIIIAQTIYPSELVRFWVQKAKGIILQGQGLTAHISILSRSLNIPLLLTGSKDIHRLPNNTDIIVDATQGILHIKPDQQLIGKYREIAKKKHPPIPEDLSEKSYTRDGHRIVVDVNVNILHDAEAGFERKAEGIGLYRSEFPFLIQNDFPSEEQQVQVYEKICGIADGRDTVLRTLDIGGDKLPGYIDMITEDNPFLGFRGIRYSLEARDIFYEQIRAMLRAGAEKQLHILFPMVSSLEEFIEAKQAVRQCIEDLRTEGYECCDRPKIGAMVEVPSAVEIAAELAQEADFLSIGTNDLIMYLLAVDRGNERVGTMHTAHHPAVLRTLKRFVDTVRTVRSDVSDYISVCGDAAGDMLMLPFLIGIDICRISVEPSKLVQVKQLISGLSYDECRSYAASLLQARTIQDVEQKISETYWCSLTPDTGDPRPEI